MVSVSALRLSLLFWGALFYTVSRSHKRMKSTYVKIGLFVLIVGLLTACGGQGTNTPATSPTSAVAPATEAPTDPPLPTDTAAPTAASAATEPAAQGATVSFANDILPIIQ